MKNVVNKILCNVVLIVGLAGFANAQQAKDCQNIDEVAQQSCFQELVAYNLSELIEYPTDAKTEGKEGQVVVRFTTDENNEIQNVRVLGRPDEQLSAAVLTAVEKLRAQNHKQMMLANTVYRIPVEFNLDY